MKASGHVPDQVRFQVSLPSPLSPVMAFVAPDSRAAVHAAYAPAMLSELATLLAEIPHDDLAIQWDICQDVGVLEDFWPAWWPDRDAGLIERIKPLMDAVPDDVELGVHLCYGDFGHQHFSSPRTPPSWYGWRTTSSRQRVGGWISCICRCPETVTTRAISNRSPILS